MSSAKQWVFLIDPDSQFLESVKKSQKPEHAAQYGVVQCASLRNAQRDLAKAEPKAVAVFINPTIGASAWLSLVHLAKLHKAGAAIWLIQNTPGDFFSSYVQDLGLKGVISKPLQWKHFQECLGQLASVDPKRPDARPAPGAGAQSVPPRALSAAPVGPTYVPVQLGRSAVGVPMMFDLYVRLSANYYTKVVQSGASITQDNLDLYGKDGMNNLCIVQSERDKFLSFCGGLMDRIVAGRASVEQRLTEWTGFGLDVLSFLHAQGASPESAAQAFRYLEYTQSLLEEVSKDSAAVARFLSDLRVVEHGVATVMIGGLALQGLGGVSQGVFRSVGMGCFLHDISLFGKSDALVQEDESRMTPQEKQWYQRHSLESAAILRKIPSLQPAVATAVAAHHLRMDRVFRF